MWDAWGNRGRRKQIENGVLDAGYTEFDGRYDNQSPNDWSNDARSFKADADFQYVATYDFGVPVLRVRIKATLNDEKGREWLDRNEIRLQVKMTNDDSWDTRRRESGPYDMRLDTVVFYGIVGERKFTASRTLAPATPINGYVKLAGWPMVYPRTYLNWDDETQFVLSED